MKARQGTTFNLILGGWVIVDYLTSLLKKTEVQAIIFNMSFTNPVVGGVAIEMIAALDLIDVQLWRDGDKKLVDCTLGDLVRLNMIKSKTTNGAVPLLIPANGLTYNCEVVLPFADPSRPNPKDTCLVVDSIKTLELQMRNNNAALLAISAVETMQILEPQKNSMRVTSDRYILRAGVVVPAGAARWDWPLQSAYRTLSMIIGTHTLLQWLMIDGANDNIVDGEPDEIIAYCQTALAINPQDTALTSVGGLLTDTCIPIPYIADKEGYGGTIQQRLNFRFDSAAGVALRVVNDQIVPPGMQRVKEYMDFAMPELKPGQYKIRAVDKNGASLTNEKMQKATVIPQVKITPLAGGSKPSNPGTAELNIEAMLNSD